MQNDYNDVATILCNLIAEHSSGAPPLSSPSTLSRLQLKFVRLTQVFACSENGQKPIIFCCLKILQLI